MKSQSFLPACTAGLASNHRLIFSSFCATITDHGCDAYQHRQDHFFTPRYWRHPSLSLSGDEMQ